MSRRQRFVVLVLPAVVFIGSARAAELDEAAVADLCRCLQSGDAQMRRQAVEHLAELGDRGVGALLAVLCQPPESTAKGAEAGLKALAERYGPGAGTPAKRARLIAQLRQYLDGDAGDEAKRTVLGVLRSCGGEEVVPAIAGALRQPELAATAASALSDLPYPEALAALRAALPDAAGPAQRDIIGALADRQDVLATPLLAALLTTDDAETRIAVWRAMQRIGDPQAAPALVAALGQGDDVERDAACNACLAVGQRLEDAGEGAEALRAYLLALKTAPTSGGKCALLARVTKLGTAADAPAVFPFLADRDRSVREAAGRCLSRMSAPQGPSGAPATDVLDAATRDPNPEVRLEALRLLGRTTGPEFEEALGAAAEAGSMEAKARAAELYLDLGDRQWKAAQDAPLEAYAQALDLATTDEVHSRALRALAALATARPPAKESFVHNDALVQAAQAARADAARRRDERAQAAEALEAAGKDSDPRVRWEALRRLGRVNGPEAEETLRALGATGTVPELASVAEVYLELGNERWRAARDVPLDAYARALDLAAADHVRHQALNALAVLGRATPPTDGRAGPIRSVREAALAAYVTAAGRIADQGQAERAVGMLRKVLDLDATRQTRAAATAKLRELGVDIDPAALVGFVTHWWVIGPFPGHDIAREYPPERGVDLAAEINGLKWVKHHTPDVSGLVDLNSFVQPDRDVTAYLYAEVTVDRDHAVLLKTGSDDNEKIWLNGQVIYTYPDNRSITIDDNTVNAQLVAGRNGILVKVGNDGLGWLVCLRITDPDGRPLDFIQRTD